MRGDVQSSFEAAFVGAFCGVFGAIAVAWGIRFAHHVLGEVDE